MSEISIDEMNKELFALAIEAAATLESEQGIGTLSEGILHSAVKYYYQSDSKFHEVKIGGFVCDAVTDVRGWGHTVLEVQTAGFGNLKKKLYKFLPLMIDRGYSKDDGEAKGLSPKLSEIVEGDQQSFPGKVTVVYPMDSEKQIIWIDPDTGEAKAGGRSPIGFVPARCLWELYRIKEWVRHPDFRFVILGIKVKEEKLLCGKSRDRKRFGARRVARIPLELTHEMVFSAHEDYAAIIPHTLGDSFDSKEFRRAAKMTEKRASFALGTLLALGLVTRKREGRGYRYTRIYAKK